MNLIFTVVFIASVVALLFLSPDLLLSSMLTGGEKALSLTLNLVVVYSIWMGVFGVMEKTDIPKRFARLFTPVNRLLFGNLTEKENEYVSLNVSANMLGLTGATTPMGIAAVKEMEKREDNEDAVLLFFIVNATSIQLIPTSVIALRSQMGSTAPTDVLLPTLIATFVSSAVGVLLFFIFKNTGKKKAAGMPRPLKIKKRRIA